MKIEYPYPPDDGSTHWDGCWRERRHHNCAVGEIKRLREALEEIAEKKCTCTQAVGPCGCGEWCSATAQDALAHTEPGEET